MLGEKWKALSDDERRPYVEKAAADKKRYDEEKKSYLVRDYPFSPWMINGALTFYARLAMPMRRRNRPKCQNLTGLPCLDRWALLCRWFLLVL